MTTKIFLSYASEQSDAAAAIELSLTGGGYSVFHAPTSLPAGEAYDAQIQAAIDESDVFVFLISQASVTSGRYSLTELKFAEEKWPHPAGHVLPVLVEAVPKESIPIYLRAVTMLQPRGNLTAEVAATVVRMAAPWWRRMLKPARLVPAILASLIIGGAVSRLPPYFKQRDLERQAVELVRQSEQKADAGNSTDAWKLLEQAQSTAPESAAVIDAQERLAMKSLRSAGITYYRGNRSDFTDHANKMAPFLIRGAAVAKGERLANILAHQGWSDYLRQLGGVGGPSPAEHYRRALEIDPGNVYAHAMWGFELLRARRSSSAIAEAKKHFGAALESKAERDYLRKVQVSAFMQSYTNVWIADPVREAEALKVAQDMRLKGEAAPSGWAPGALKRTLWSIYHFDVITDGGLASLLAELPAKEQLGTFRWLFPENDLSADSSAPALFNYLYALGQLQEHAGDRAGALDSFRRLLSEFASKGYSGAQAIKVSKVAQAAIKRLSSEKL